MSGATMVSPQAAKMAFLDSAIDESIVIPSQAYAPGAELRFEIPNVGVAKKFRVLFNIPVTAGATAPTGVGAKAPFSLFTRAYYQDYAGIDRVSAHPWLLNLLNLVKKFGFDPSSTGPTNPGVGSLVWSNTDTQFTGYFDIPIAPSEADPTGSLNLEVANGKTYLVLQCNPNFFSTSGIDAPLVGPAGCTAAPSAGASVQVVYYFWQPVSSGGKLIRPDHILYPYVIHELLGTRESDNLSAGQDKLFTLRTGREYHRVIHSLVNNNALDTSIINRIRFLYNGNTPTMDETVQANLSRMRDWLYRDLPPGSVYHNFTRRPWDSNKWGQLQSVLSISSGATLTSPYLDTLTEAFYQPQSA